MASGKSQENQKAHPDLLGGFRVGRFGDGRGFFLTLLAFLCLFSYPAERPANCISLSERSRHGPKAREQRGVHPHLWPKALGNNSSSSPSCCSTSVLIVSALDLTNIGIPTGGGSTRMGTHPLLSAWEPQRLNHMRDDSPTGSCTAPTRLSDRAARATREAPHAGRGGGCVCVWAGGGSHSARWWWPGSH